MTAESGADRLVEIAGDLQNHRRAVNALIDKPNDYRYWGRGGALALPDGRAYFASADSKLLMHDRGTQLDVRFWGPDRREPNILASLGAIAMLVKDGQVSLTTAEIHGHGFGDDSLRSNDFPGIVELAQPLWPWAATAGQKFIDKKYSLAAAEVDYKGEMDTLNNYLRDDALDLELPGAYAKAYGMVRRALDASKRIDSRSKPALYAPSLEDVKPLHDFIHQPNGVSAFAITKATGYVYYELVDGPLLGQS